MPEVKIPGLHVARATKFCTMAPVFVGPLSVNILAPRTLRWLLECWENLCILALRKRHTSSSQSLQHPEDGGNTTLRNVGINLLSYTVGCMALKMKAVQSFETPGTSRRKTRRHISADCLQSLRATVSCRRSRVCSTHQSHYRVSVFN
jgi:hypothetical protein